MLNIYRHTGSFLVLALAFKPAVAATPNTVMQNVQNVQSIIHSLQQPQSDSAKLVQQLKERIADGQSMLNLRIRGPKPTIPTPYNPKAFIGHATPEYTGVDGSEVRTCEAVRQDWIDLEKLLGESAVIAVELGKVVNEDVICYPCLDDLLAKLQGASDRLQEIQSNLQQDGDRYVSLHWNADFFQKAAVHTQYAMHLEDWDLVKVSWDKLTYYNVDGDSHVDLDSQGLTKPAELIAPLHPAVSGVSFKKLFTTDRACDSSFEVNFISTADVRFQKLNNPPRSSRDPFIRFPQYLTKTPSMTLYLRL